MSDEGINKLIKLMGDVDDWHCFDDGEIKNKRFNHLNLGEYGGSFVLKIIPGDGSIQRIFLSEALSKKELKQIGKNYEKIWKNHNVNKRQKKRDMINAVLAVNAEVVR